MFPPWSEPVYLSEKSPHKLCCLAKRTVRILPGLTPNLGSKAVVLRTGRFANFADRCSVRKRSRSPAPPPYWNSYNVIVTQCRSPSALRFKLDPRRPHKTPSRRHIGFKIGFKISPRPKPQRIPSSLQLDRRQSLFDSLVKFSDSLFIGGKKAVEPSVASCRCSRIVLQQASHTQSLAGTCWNGHCAENLRVLPGDIRHSRYLAV